MAEKKTETKVAKVKEVKEPVVVAEKRGGWDMSRAFWGLLLVLVGLLILLDNLDIVDVNLANVWQLWPLLIVGWGVSLLKLPGVGWSVVSMVLMLASLALVAWAAVGTGTLFDRAETRNFTEQVAVESDGTKNLDVIIEAGVGDITIESTDENSVGATLDSSFANLYRQSRTVGDTQRVLISTHGNNMMWRGDMHNELAVRLPKEILTIATLKAGASDVSADLADINLRELVLDTGASSVNVTLGDVANKLDVELNVGASSIVMRVPKESGIKVELDSGLSSRNLEGLVNKGDGIYETDNFDTATKTIQITGSMGVASFELVRY